jgi:hypothetical protein
MSPDPTPRSRGGQPGNHNAFKARLVDLVHADELELTIADFYAARLDTQELADLQTRRTGLLAEEINLIRVLIRRLMVHADTRDSGVKMEILRAVSQASLNLAKVIQIEHNVQPQMDYDRLMRAVNQKLEVKDRQELQAAHANQYHPAPEPDQDEEDDDLPNPQPNQSHEEIPVPSGSIFDITHHPKKKP